MVGFRRRDVHYQGTGCQEATAECTGAGENRPPKTADPTDHRRREREQTRAEMTEARQTKRDADEQLRRRHTDLAAARTAHDEAQMPAAGGREDAQDAERAYADAEAAGLAAAARIEELRERLEQLRR